jgi:hypothetical protein
VEYEPKSTTDIESEAEVPSNKNPSYLQNTIDKDKKLPYRAGSKLWFVGFACVVMCMAGVLYAKRKAKLNRGRRLYRNVQLTIPGSAI